MKSGTLFFLNTGERLFAVTAAHVVQECLDDTRSPMFLQSMIGANGCTAIPIHLGDRFIEGNSTMDIATFRVSPEELAFTKRTPLTGFQRAWPPRLAQINRGVTYCGGFPGAARRWLGDAISLSGALRWPALLPASGDLRLHSNRKAKLRSFHRQSRHAGVCRWIGIDIVIGSAEVVATIVASDVRSGMPERIGKYMVA